MVDLTKTAVVTGSASGIGKATATLLAQSGYYVLCADIAAEGARAIAEDLNEQGLPALWLGIDVSDPEATEAMIARAIDWTGRLDVVVANAAARVDREPQSLGVAHQVREANRRAAAPGT